MTPSPRLVVVLLLGLTLAAAPLFYEPAWPAPLALWAALGLACTIDALVIAHASLTLQVRVPERVGVGSPLSVALELERRGRAPLALSVRPECSAPLSWRADERSGTERVDAGRLPDERIIVPPGRSTLDIELEANRRGTATVSAIWTRLEGPFGLLHRLRRHPLEQAEVAIVPNMGFVQRILLQHFGSRPTQGGQKRERQTGDGTEFDALHTYVQGMDLRHVDWKATARHQALCVRHFRLERNQRLVLCVDAGRLMADPIGDLERLDHAVHALLALGHAALKAGDLVGLYGYAAQPVRWLPPASGVRQTRALAEACARMHSQDQESNHVLGLQGLLGKLRRRSLVVIFTDFVDATSAELMLETLGHLLRRHLVIFVALDDPAFEQTLARPPHGYDDVARAVVATGLRWDRHAVLARLRRMGAHVVHAKPGLVPLQLLDRYLRIKRRGLIG